MTKLKAALAYETKKTACNLGLFAAGVAAAGLATSAIAANAFASEAAPGSSAFSCSTASWLCGSQPRS